jgi:protease stability complex PrcB-like protein
MKARMIVALAFVALSCRKDSAAKTESVSSIQRTGAHEGVNPIAMTPLLWTDPHFSGLRDGPRIRTVLHDSAAFAKAWLEITGDSTGLPLVDFSHFNVLLVAAPSERTGGYSIHVDSVYRRNQQKTIYVAVTETAPGQYCPVTDDGSRPLFMTTVPASTDVVSFIERRSLTSCQPP